MLLCFQVPPLLLAMSATNTPPSFSLQNSKWTDEMEVYSQNIHKFPLDTSGHVAIRKHGPWVIPMWKLREVHCIGHHFSADCNAGRAAVPRAERSCAYNCCQTRPGQKRQLTPPGFPRFFLHPLAFGPMKSEFPLGRVMFEEHL